MAIFFLIIPSILVAGLLFNVLRLFFKGSQFLFLICFLLSLGVFAILYIRLFQSLGGAIGSL